MDSRLWLLLAIVSFSRAAALSPLASRGYAVLPEPQRVKVGAVDFMIGSDWGVELSGVVADDVAVRSLRDELRSRFGLTLGHSAGKVVRLALSPGAVEIGDAADRDKHILAQQAYRMALSEFGITVTANASQGLFYGIQTLVQLIKRANGALWLPEAEIVDWPDLQFRGMYWDDAHHLDRLEELKRAVRQAAFFKINAFVLKLEGHFQYKSAPALVEPQALSPSEFQELTDYGLRYFVQVVPYLDAPSHIAFILKHPAYAGLRAFPDSNYEACATNPDTYKLYYGMFQDLLDANKGVKYFYLSTDEAYYIGKADNAQCREVEAARQLGSVGKLLAQVVTKLADYLHDRGRTVVFWGEYPLKPDDIASLPSHLVNGEVYGPVFDPLFRKHGIREMIYTSTEGEEKLFPDYFVLPPARRLHIERGKTERVASAVEKISFDPARRNADLMGMIVAGWADMGLHPETFWLGYATVTAAGWRPGSDPRESMNTFYPLFYGPAVTNMDRVYQLLSWQAQFWADSWETVSSTARKPIWGNSNTIYSPGRAAHDQNLALPPAPSPEDLAYPSKWSEENVKRLEMAAQMLPESDELTGLLHYNLRPAEWNRYNLEVFLAITQLCRQNLTMLLDLGRMDALLVSAQNAARNKQAKQAVASLDQAIALAGRMRAQRNAALRDAIAVWYKSWHPRVAEGNGRRFLHELDDVKDHLPDRTVDMSYLVYRQLLLPLGEWVEKVQAARNTYAQRNGVPSRSVKFDWKDLHAAGLQPVESPEE